MIELSGDMSFEKAVELFLLMDDEERDLSIEQIEMFLAAAFHAEHLTEIQTTH